MTLTSPGADAADASDGPLPPPAGPDDASEALQEGWLSRRLSRRRVRRLIPTVHRLTDDVLPVLQADRYLRHLLEEHARFMEEDNVEGAIRCLNEIDGLIARICIDYFRRQDIRRIRVEAISVPNGRPVRVILILRALGYQGRQYFSIDL